MNYTKLILLLISFNSFALEKTAIRQVLEDYSCLACHGDEVGDVQEASDLVEKFMKGGRAVNSFSADTSSFYTQILSGEMPPGDYNVSSDLVQAVLLELEELYEDEEAVDVVETQETEKVVEESVEDLIKNQELIYRKCLGIVAGEYLNKNDPTLVKIRNGEISGADACINDFPSPENKTFTVNSDREISILNTFQDLHLNWFPKNKSNIGYIKVGTLDNEDPAFFFTQSLFNEQRAWSEAIKSDELFRAIRVDENGVRNKRIKEDVVGFYKFDPVRTDEGKLIGLEEVKEDEKVVIVSGDNPHTYPQSEGGGAITSFAYIESVQKGSDRSKGTQGGLDLYRQYSKEFYKDFLCLDLPALIAKEEYVFHGDEPSKLAFRNKASCMSCHWSMDRLALGFANKVIKSTEGAAGNEPYDFLFLGKSTPQSLLFMQETQIDLDLNAFKFSDDGWYPTYGKWGIEPENAGNYNGKYDYFLYERSQNNQGYLSFIDYKNVEHDDHFVGLSSLSDVVASKDQYYACSISRYLEFFTGVSVNLNSDLTLRMGQTNADISYRDFIDQQVQELKNHQDMKKVIKSILESPVFLNPSLGVEK